MTEKKMVKLTKVEIFWHYNIVFGLLFLLTLTLKFLFDAKFADNSSSGIGVAEILNMILLIVLAILAFTYIQYRRLRFLKIKTNYNEENFQEAIRRTSKELKWRIKKNNKKFLRAYRPSDNTISRGEMITIIKDDNEILINSICIPDTWISLTSFGWNNKNVRTFQDALHDTLNGIETSEVNNNSDENEYSYKRTLARVIMYILCTVLIVLGIFLILNRPTFSSLLASIFIIVVSLTYIYYDLKIILTKNDD